MATSPPQLASRENKSPPALGHPFSTGGCAPRWAVLSPFVASDGARQAVVRARAIDAHLGAVLREGGGGGGGQYQGQPPRRKGAGQHLRTKRGRLAGCQAGRPAGRAHAHQDSRRPVQRRARVNDELLRPPRPARPSLVVVVEVDDVAHVSAAAAGDKPVVAVKGRLRAEKHLQPSLRGGGREG